MDKQINLSQKEIQLIYTACMSYGNKLSEITRSIPNEETGNLTKKANESYDLASKITAYMEYEEDKEE